MLFSEPKIPQSYGRVRYERSQPTVSVLFSEPKIPQSSLLPYERRIITLTFQCSSASRKFLNSRAFRSTVEGSVPGFSALQRAENSSIRRDTGDRRRNAGFQCSSASRKFLNSAARLVRSLTARVSVLFSEPKIPQSKSLFIVSSQRCVSVLFSEPKIPQYSLDARWRGVYDVSVLFSEPKIPQFVNDSEPASARVAGFSALQRAENSSIVDIIEILQLLAGFSALQRAENSSIRRR